VDYSDVFEEAAMTTNSELKSLTSAILQLVKLQTTAVSEIKAENKKLSLKINKLTKEKDRASMRIEALELLISVEEPRIEFIEMPTAVHESIVESVEVSKPRRNHLSVIREEGNVVHLIPRSHKSKPGKTVTTKK